MEGGSGGAIARIWEDRWRIACWVLPALILSVFAQKAVLPLAQRLTAARDQLSILRENTYEPAWLDSTRGELAREVGLLRAFHASREAALTRDGNIQVTVDRIRGLAQRVGVEVVKTTPILAKADSLRLLKVRVEGFTRYGGLLAFCDSLRADRPDLYLEEMLVRAGEHNDGRLEATLVVHAYDRRREGGR